MVDYDVLLQEQILNLCRLAASDQDKAFLKRLSIEEQIVEQLLNISPEGIRRLARLKPFKTQITKPFFSIQLDAELKNSERMNNICKAIQLGMSRESLKDVIGLSRNEYDRLKAKAGVEKAPRSKPRRLSEADYDLIEKIDTNLRNMYTRQGETPDILAILIKLSEASGIAINEIYLHYYLENLVGDKYA